MRGMSCTYMKVGIDKEIWGENRYTCGRGIIERGVRGVSMAG